MKHISEVLREDPFSHDERTIELERRERFRRTSADWAGSEEDLGDDARSDEVRCHTCYEAMRPIDAFVTQGGGIYCGACRKQIDDIANGE